MKFIMTAGWDDGIADLTERLVRELASGKRVLWLTSGGSNVPATVQIIDNIPSKLCQKLTVLLADERYGPIGHKESNWEQLIKAGFDPSKANSISILQDDLDLENTVKKYNSIASKAFAQNDIVLAQLGIGPDGHIAGLLLGSSALQNSHDFVTGFQSNETPALVRMTLTFDALKNIDAAYCFAFGQPKHETLNKLQKKQLTLSEQPAQILRQIPEAYIYNDQIGHHA